MKSKMKINILLLGIIIVILFVSLSFSLYDEKASSKIDFGNFDISYNNYNDISELPFSEMLVCSIKDNSCLKLTRIGGGD